MENFTGDSARVMSRKIARFDSESRFAIIYILYSGGYLQDIHLPRSVG